MQLSFRITAVTSAFIGLCLAATCPVSANEPAHAAMRFDNHRSPRPLVQANAKVSPQQNVYQNAASRPVNRNNGFLPAAQAHPAMPSVSKITLPIQAQRAIGVTLGEAQLRRLNFSIKATGEVLANSNCLTHVNSPVTGRVVSVKVQVGDRVSQGQTVLTIRSSDIEQAQAELLQNEGQVRADLKRDLLQIDADVNQQKAQVALSQSVFNRIQNLVDEKIASRADFEKAQTDLQKDTISLETLKNKRLATISLSEERMRLMTEPLKHKLRILGMSETQITQLLNSREIDPVVSVVAPEAGIVSERHINGGELVDPSKELFTIADFHSVWLKADVYEKDIARIEIGDPIELAVDCFPGLKFKGKLNYISDSVNPETRTLTVRAEVMNPGSKLKPKMFARMNILVGEQLVMSVPKESVQDAGSNKVVYVPTSPTDFDERAIKIGTQTGAYVEVLHGLRPGEKVVTKGSFELRSESFRQTD